MKLILPILIIMIFSMTVSARSADNLEAEWHPGRLCISCHNITLPQSESTRINDGCLCHYPSGKPVWEDKVDIQNIKTIHGSRPCIKCHVNSMATLPEYNIHNLHIAVTCRRCHGNEGNIKPLSTDCVTCHGHQVHGIHDLEKLCAVCHGKPGEDIVNRFKSAGIPVSADITGLSGGKIRQFPTIIEVLRSLLALVGLR